MIRSLTSPPFLSPALQDAGEWLRLALSDWLPMSGGLALETLFDRLEGRA
ncbi:MAG: hypothetical protein O9292_04755 [Rhodobacteraceae bacterium]|jgi:hypothetical protein|nr:hypothetical protein [Paracoccaceae bacterium]